jgi:hypothetical protein
VLDESSGSVKNRGDLPNISRDVKESFEVGGEDNPDMPNIWFPEGVFPGFRESCLDFYWVRDLVHYPSCGHPSLLKTCNETAKHILKALALGLSLPEDYFLAFHSQADNQLRLLHYPRSVMHQLQAGHVYAFFSAFPQAP